MINNHMHLLYNLFLKIIGLVWSNEKWLLKQSMKANIQTWIMNFISAMCFYIEKCSDWIGSVSCSQT